MSQKEQNSVFESEKTSIQLLTAYDEHEPHDSGFAFSIAPVWVLTHQALYHLKNPGEFQKQHTTLQFHVDMQFHVNQYEADLANVFRWQREMFCEPLSVIELMGGLLFWRWRPAATSWYQYITMHDTIHERAFMSSLRSIAPDEISQKMYRDIKEYVAAIPFKFDPAWLKNQLLDTYDAKSQELIALYNSEIEAMEKKIQHITTHPFNRILRANAKKG